MAAARREIPPLAYIYTQSREFRKKMSNVILSFPKKKSESFF